jgi:hypothetical protein
MTHLTIGRIVGRFVGRLRSQLIAPCPVMWAEPSEANAASGRNL